MIVTGVGISVNTSYGPVAKRRLEGVMQQVLQDAQRMGLDTTLHGEAIGLLMRQAHDAELRQVQIETLETQIAELKVKLQQVRDIL